MVISQKNAGTAELVPALIDTDITKKYVKGLQCVYMAFGQSFRGFNLDNIESETDIVSDVFENRFRYLPGVCLLVREFFSQNRDSGVIEIAKRTFFWMFGVEHPKNRIGIHIKSIDGIQAPVLEKPDMI